MSEVIAIANQKGGVGKTMTSVSLSACLALNNKKVLLLDLDPQGHSTKAFGFYEERKACNKPASFFDFNFSFCVFLNYTRCSIIK